MAASLNCLSWKMLCSALLYSRPQSMVIQSSNWILCRRALLKNMNNERQGAPWKMFYILEHCDNMSTCLSKQHLTFPVFYASPSKARDFKCAVLYLSMLPLQSTFNILILWWSRVAFANNVSFSPYIYIWQ